MRENPGSAQTVLELEQLLNVFKPQVPHKQTGNNNGIYSWSSYED